MRYSNAELQSILSNIMEDEDLCEVGSFAKRVVPRLIDELQQQRAEMTYEKVDKADTCDLQTLV
jgi:hypothetical protein